MQSGAEKIFLRACWWRGKETRGGLGWGVEGEEFQTERETGQVN